MLIIFVILFEYYATYKQYRKISMKCQKHGIENVENFTKFYYDFSRKLHPIYLVNSTLTFVHW